MPKSNAKYPFQYKVLEKTAELGGSLFGETRERLGFIIELDDTGQIVKSVGEEQNPDFLQLDEKFDSFLLFDVFDSGAYVYLNWRNIDSDHLKALLNISLSDKDFAGFENAKGDTCPRSHSVMF
ncbi:MAG: hypothetical protein HN764_15265 [Gammaproteobacteria bacterium]|jgi:hypothetical protein|nr:hypothetical protein [Gammaproteobacteria bacterium]